MKTVALHVQVSLANLGGLIVLLMHLCEVVVVRYFSSRFSSHRTPCSNNSQFLGLMENLGV